MTDDPDTPKELQPTFIRLKHALDGMLNGVDEKTEIVFFYSGHGVRQNDEDWRVPEEGDPQDVAGSCVSYTRWRNKLDTLRPHRALLVVDACRNLHDAKGEGSSSCSGNRRRRWPNNVLQQFAARHGHATLRCPDEVVDCDDINLGHSAKPGIVGEEHAPPVIDCENAGSGSHGNSRESSLSARFLDTHSWASSPHAGCWTMPRNSLKDRRAEGWTGPAAEGSR